MKQYYCNPVNLNYAYQFHKADNGILLNREASDPSLVLFKGKYYLFPSMSEGFFASEDLIQWEKYPMTGMPVYDYAPDVCVVGDWLYFCASRVHKNCDFYRTKQPESGEFECIPGTFMFWDPHMFADDDGRIYFYWGCSANDPIWGVELDPVTMKKIGTEQPLIRGKKTENGFERGGENHGKNLDPFVEGAWMNKQDGRYYLQYAAPGTEFNVYGDGTYVSDKPLGPYTQADNNPYSYSPGGYFPGAGHGSTMSDLSNNLWHASSMRIAKTHLFERRVGMWPAGFDKDGELFCNQRYGDWPIGVNSQKQDAWAEPEWMLLSYGKRASASSEELPAENAVDENVQTWWKAASADPEEWLQVDLGQECMVHAIQINFADDFGLLTNVPDRVKITGYGRYIDTEQQKTNWLLEGSTDGEKWLIIEDKREVATDLPHDLVVCEEGKQIRYVRLTVTKLPYNAAACVSGLRLFGKMKGEPPIAVSNVRAERIGNLDMQVTWEGTAMGYEVLWGHTPDKLYHSYRVFDKNAQKISALVASQKEYYVRVDAFNECGITHGAIVKVQPKVNMRMVK